MNRRHFLLGGAAVLLAGCAGGKDDPRLNTQRRELTRRSVAIDYASLYPPFEDLKRLAMARAVELNVEVTFSDDAAGTDAQIANLKRWTGPQGGFRAIAVAPFDVAAVDPVIAAAKDVAIIAYVTELPHQTAAITVDRAQMGRLLAERAKAHGGGVLVVRPPAQFAVPDPFAPGFDAADAAIREVVDVAATVSAQAQSDAGPLIAAAFDQDRSLKAVLCWNDTTALGAVDAVGKSAFIGALGAPSLSGRAALDAPIDCLVAPRLSDLANALIEVPAAYARGEKPGSRAIAVGVVEDREAYASDFA